MGASGRPLSCRVLRLMFDEICGRQALLVAEWMRVGYVQGNMNSDKHASAEKR